MHRVPYAIVVLLSCLCASCYDKSGATESDAFLPAQALGELTEKKLDEVSGLAASVANPGLLWTLNDSNNPAAVYLVDEALKIVLTCKLRGVKNRDWEDIAVGRGPDSSKRYVYVADIGDNNAKHELKYIYRFEEPLIEGHSGTLEVSAFDTIVFRLEGKKKDTETIMIHPESNDIYVVSKREKPVVVYELKYPFSAGDTLTASPIVSLPLTQIVAGGFSPDGKEILMKNYENIYYWKIKDKSIVDALKIQPETLPYTEEPQGESLAFNLDGTGFYTLSEKIKGEKTYLYFYKRR